MTVDGSPTRIGRRLAELKRARRCGLVVYLTAGDPSVVRSFRAHYGLDKPLPERYVIYLGHVARGNVNRPLVKHQARISGLVAPGVIDLGLRLGEASVAVERPRVRILGRDVATYFLLVLSQLECGLRMIAVSRVHHRECSRVAAQAFLFRQCPSFLRAALVAG